MHILDGEYLGNCDGYDKFCYFYQAARHLLTHLDLTLAHFKCQGLYRTYFTSEYLENGNR